MQKLESSVKNDDVNFVRFDTIPECDGRTDRQTDGRTDISQLAMPALAQLAVLPRWQKLDTSKIKSALCYETN